MSRALPGLVMVMKVMALSLPSGGVAAHPWCRSAGEEQPRLSWKWGKWRRDGAQSPWRGEAPCGAIPPQWGDSSNPGASQGDSKAFVHLGPFP